MNERFNPYIALFHGERVADSVIKEKADYARPAVDVLFKSGDLIGQRTLEGDIIWWMPAKVKEVENGG